MFYWNVFIEFLCTLQKLKIGFLKNIMEQWINELKNAPYVGANCVGVAVPYSF